MKQFPMSDCRYGAPMGRHNFGLIQNCKNKSVSVFKMRIDSGGYDDGAHYWGSGMPIYCARSKDGEFQNFARAKNRTAAIESMNIDPEYLKRCKK